MSKTKKIWIMTALACIVVGLLLAVFAFARTGFRYSELNSAELYTKVYDMEESFSSIDISAAECDVYFYPIKDGACRVECREDAKITHTVSVENETLVVARKDHRKWYEHIGFFWGDMSIKVYLPERMYRELKVLSVSGDISIPREFTFEEAELITTSGDILLEGLVQKSLTAKTVSGDLTVYNVSGDTASVQSTSGDIKFSDFNVETLHIDSTSGEVTLHDGIASQKISIETVSGDIHLDQCDSASLWLKAVSGDIKGFLLTEKHFTTHTTSGDVRVSESFSAVQPCEVTTTSGDIHISTGQNG